MRRTFIALASLLAIGFVWWWTRSPSAPYSASKEVPKAQEDSQASTGQVSDEKLKQPEPDPAQAAVVKAVGSHQGKPIAYRSRRRSGGQNSGTDTEPMQRYQGLALSAAVEINKRKQLVLGARAVPKADYLPYMGQILFEQDGYVVVPADKIENWKDLVVRQSDRPLVVNPGNGRLGIVTGTMVVKLADPRKADLLAGRENFQLLHLDERTGIAHYRVPENYSLLKGAEALRKNQDVLRVELEIFQAAKGAW